MELRELTEEEAAALTEGMRRRLYRSQSHEEFERRLAAFLAASEGDE